jgi:hypothetical protein
VSSLKIKKSSWARRRFIESAPLKSVEAWMDEASRIKQQILTDSSFQLVGDKVHLQVNSGTDVARVLVEVLGIPRAGLNVVDLEPCEVLVYNYPEDLFSVDFLTLKKTAVELKSKLSYSVAEDYHIVFEGKNLALHFFIQKDYIQTTQ